MTATHEMPLDLPAFEALDNALRHHRAAALLSPLAPEPIDAFQADMAAAAGLLGFHPTEPGAFRIQIQPGGHNLLCWEPVQLAPVGPTLH